MANTSVGLVTIPSSLTTVFQAGTISGPDGAPGRYFYAFVTDTSSFPLRVKITLTTGEIFDDLVPIGKEGHFRHEAGGAGAIEKVELAGSGGSATNVVWAMRGK